MSGTSQELELDPGGFTKSRVILEGKLPLCCPGELAAVFGDRGCVDGTASICVAGG